MTDASHFFGADLSVSASGDLALSGGDLEAEQAVTRRLLTNPDDYIQHPTYGAGLGQFVGQPNATSQIAATARQQMKLERDVLQNPPPQITVSTDNLGTVVLTIVYTSALTGKPVTLRLPVN